MKRILAVMLLMTATVQANDLSEAWNNLGRKHRVVSGAKAVLVGGLAYEAICATFLHGKVAFNRIGDSGDWKREKIEDIAYEGVIAGSTFYAAYYLGYHFLPAHLKHALAMS